MRAGRFTLSGPKPGRLSIEIALTNATGKTLRLTRVLSVRPHDPAKERRRRPPYGPSNQTGI